MPLLTELEIIFAVILQICHAYGVRTHEHSRDIKATQECGEYIALDCRVGRSRAALLPVASVGERFVSDLCAPEVD